MSEAENADGFYCNKVSLTGLNGNSTYTYRYGNDGVWSDVDTYETPDYSSDAYSFVVVGDPQLGASGDAESDADGWYNTLRTALSDGTDYGFIFSMGDQVETSTSEVQYNLFLDTDSLRGIPMGIIAALLVYILFSKILNISGYNSEDVDSLVLLAKATGLSIRNLLLIPVSITALGAVMDVTLSLASALDELRTQNKNLNKKQLIKSGMNIGKDMIGTMGQYIQQGKRLMFETVVRFGASGHQLTVPTDEGDGDGLNFLAGKSVDFIRDRAMEGTLLAHTDGGVPNLIVDAGEKSAETLGALIYFFEFACGLSGCLLDVNPFDQPGVEDYKKNMFALLGKPGYEDRRAKLEEKLK